MVASEFERHRGSSKFFICIITPVIIIYFLGHVIRMFMTDGETKVSNNILKLFALENRKYSWQIFMLPTSG